jgi:exodeoxyribonuclease III
MIMKIISWNVNGLRAISQKGFSDWVELEQPDILCIQETKLQDNQLVDEFRSLKNDYFSYFSFAEKKGYSGVATYSKLEPISIKHGFNIDKFDNEGRIVITEYEQFILLNIYFPNGQMSDDRLKYKLDFYDALLNYCNELSLKNKNIIVCGDYNTAHREIDIKNAKSNEKTSGFLPQERAWIDKFISAGYTDIYRYLHPEKIEYSWWSYMFKARERNVGWRIDYHFISNNMIQYVADAKILTNVTGSDHCPIALELNI